MVYAVLLIIMLGVLSSSLGLFPEYRQIANRLLTIICVLTAMIGLAELIVREGMFSDLIMLERQYILRALAALAFCILSAAAVSFAMRRRKVQYIHYK